MIVRDPPSGLRMFILLRGSVLLQIRIVLLVNVLLVTAVTLAHSTLFSHKITLTAISFTLIGLPLAIFLGFRNTAAYERYWEARKLWGELLLRCRNLTRQCQTLIAFPEPVQQRQPCTGLVDVRVRMIYRAIAFCHVLRQQLRQVSDSSEIQALPLPSEWEVLTSQQGKTEALMRAMGADLQHCRREGRIKSAPLSFSYTLLLHRTAYMYRFCYPLAWSTPSGS